MSGNVTSPEGVRDTLGGAVLALAFAACYFWVNALSASQSQANQPHIVATVFAVGALLASGPLVLVQRRLGREQR